ncbi:MAG: protein phosphatase 2C domain-containing protein [Alphaproteobacteria bacterium]|nr:protein phosphatase 2C domain-containing protein [Alphaproteobacteria bacterium]
MRIRDVISAPGTSLLGGLKDGSGDDRFAYDEQAGWACVIDGATDVGPVRLFPDAESDAAWFAEAVARTCLEYPAASAERLDQYFVRLVSELRHRCARASIIPLEVAPRASLPTAAVTWMRWARGNLEAATLGDTLALIETPDGKIGVIGDVARPEDESARARQVMQMSRDDRLRWLAELRARHNVEAGYWILGVQPEAASHLVCQTHECPEGSRGLLMTDGFYRLVSPYGRFTHRDLIRRAFEDGLGTLMTELRLLEASPDEDAEIGRFKTSDDATALMIEF